VTGAPSIAFAAMPGTIFQTTTIDWKYRFAAGTGAGRAVLALYGQTGYRKRRFLARKTASGRDT
jgi:hypothetical protein